MFPGALSEDCSLFGTVNGIAVDKYPSIFSERGVFYQFMHQTDMQMRFFLKVMAERRKHVLYFVTVLSRKPVKDIVSKA